MLIPECTPEQRAARDRVCRMLRFFEVVEEWREEARRAELRADETWLRALPVAPREQVQVRPEGLGGWRR